MRKWTARHQRPPLTVAQVLAWADDHYARTGRWPNQKSGPIPGSAGDTWAAVCMALVQGGRGLPGGTPLARFLQRHRGKPHPADTPPLTAEQILGWADDYRRRTGRWPTPLSGPIDGQSALTWKSVNDALAQGFRGLPGGSSLARLLAERRGARNKTNLPDLTTDLILEWADRHHARTGQWPRQFSGPVAGVEGETWLAVDLLLRRGGRGLPGGSSLPRLLAAARGVRNKAAVPRLTVTQILRWARAHRRRTGRRPNASSGPIPEAPGETWNAVNLALVQGGRGLPGGSSLAQLVGSGKRQRDRKKGRRGG
jgi:hypothetical protein